MSEGQPTSAVACGQLLPRFPPGVKFILFRNISVAFPFNFFVCIILNSEKSFLKMPDIKENLAPYCYC